MPLIIRKTHIYRKDVRAEPEAFFIFGDNAERKGFGGQAYELRGEPNGIGVATKWKPNWQDDAYFTDDDITCLKIILTDLARAEEKLNEGKIVYWPECGIGTGLAELPKRCPTLYGIIELWVKIMEKHNVTL